MKSSDIPEGVPMEEVTDAIVVVVPKSTPQSNKAQSIIDSASFLSKLFIHYMTAFVVLGAKRPIELDDLPRLPRDDHIEKISEAYNRAEEELKIENEQRLLKKGSTPSSTQPSFVRILFRGFGWRLYWSGFFHILAQGLQFVIPYMVKQLVLFFSNGESKSKGLLYALLLGIIAQAVSIFINKTFLINTRMGTMLRSAAMTQVYRKSLRLSSSSRSRSTTGETVNLMSNDAHRLFEVGLFIHFAWITPLSVAVTLVLLAFEIGWAAIAGVVLMLLLVPVQGRIAASIVKYRGAMLKHTDERVKTMSEILTGIRIVKFYAWEDPISAKIQEIRKGEISSLRGVLYGRALNAAIVFVWPVFVAATTFILYSLLGNELTLPTIFTVIAFLNAVRFPIALLPAAVNAITEARVSSERISRFLDLPELDTLNSTKLDAPEIRMDNCSFSWSVPCDVPTLQSLSLHIKPGQLIAVVGHVGGGKSSLLSAILGEMHLLDGEIAIGGKIAYTSSVAWIRNDTVRNNILFNYSYKEALYKRVVHAAALEPDLAMLPAGDSTEIGERGINLSGGQKARISLARALYRANQCNVYLLDDPLSAVDYQVGKHIIKHALLDALQGKTRIVVLNSHLHFLHHFDQIIVMDNGRIATHGSYEHVLEHNASLLHADNSIAARSERSQSLGSSNDGDGEPLPTGQNAVVVASHPLPRSASPSRLSESIVEEGDLKKIGGLIEKEDRTLGSVSGITYLNYFDSSWPGHGVLVLIVLTIAFGCSQVIKVASDYTLTLWASGTKLPEESDWFWIRLYIIFAASIFVASIIRALIYAIVNLRASQHLHDKVFRSVLRAPITTFFDVTPLGRIINRFSKDLDQVDMLLSDFLGQLFQFSCVILASFVVAAVSQPIFMAILFPEIILFLIVRRYFRRSSREIKRVEGITRSPIFSSFEETLNGLDTIRAFGMSKKFINLNSAVVEDNTRTFLTSYLIQRWLALRLDSMSVVILTTVAFLGVIFRDSVNPELAGLALVYSLELMGLLQWTVRVSIEVENNMTAVERLEHYTKNVPLEAPAIIFESRPPENWPEQGAISVTNLQLRYRPDLPLTLKGISFDIKSREKIGVCGRTGAGKSTLSLCLFRMVEPDAGSKIVIDGVDISSIGLNDLRSNLSIIPQDPTLFSGSIRKNLDMFDERTDDELWAALESVNLREFIESIGGLESSVAERGSNFSSGQRQLICIARAFLRDTKILVSDEATANVDSETDALIQRKIRELFKDRTTITVAHRLDTIMDSDRIVVLDQGTIAEFDSPARLLANPNSQFAQMVRMAEHGSTSQA